MVFNPKGETEEKCLSSDPALLLNPILIQNEDLAATEGILDTKRSLEL